jgi:predicted permease
MASRAMSSVNLGTSFSFVLDFRFDWRVFAFAFGIALLTGVLAGIVPAVRASRTNLSTMLHDGERSMTRRRQRMRSVLVVAQVAGSLALLVVAGLFTRSLGNVHMADLGFEPQHVMNFTMDPRGIGFSDAQSRDFYQQLLVRESAVPGVQFAALAATVPMGEVGLGGSIEIEGRPVSSGQPHDSANDNFVSPQYFDVMRIPLLRGRGITDGDKLNTQRVAVINETMAQKYWPKEDPVGRRFKVLDGPKETFEVVGVVKNSKTGGLTDPPEPFFYAPITQHDSTLATLQVRAAGAAESIAQDTERTIQSIAPTMPVYGVQTMSEAMKGVGGLFLFKAGAVLAAALGILGLILATVGVYGVVSYTAAQRTREIGIRMALGARPAEVLRMVCRQGMIIIGAGLVIGLAAALAIGRVVGSFLIGIGGSDPITYIIVTMALSMIGITACYLPARRAAMVDPMVALRHE